MSENEDQSTDQANTAESAESNPEEKAPEGYKSENSGGTEQADS